MAASPSAPVHGPVLLYTGLGTWGVSVDQTEQLLASYVSPLAMRRVDRLDDITSKTALVVIPGGNAGVMMLLGDSALKASAAKLATYLQRDGGRYLGICAGGILASDHMLLKPEKVGEGNPALIQQLFQESLLVKSAPLQDASLGDIYPGGCIAPFLVRDPLQRGSLDNFLPAQVSFPGEQGRFAITHYSGPVFHQVPVGARVLLHYAAPVKHHLIDGQFDARHRCLIYSVKRTLEEESPAACVAYRPGNGKVVLSGVHPEFNPATFAASAKKHEFAGALPLGVKESESQRIRFADTIFQELGMALGKAL